MFPSPSSTIQLQHNFTLGTYFIYLLLNSHISDLIMYDDDVKKRDRYFFFLIFIIVYDVRYVKLQKFNFISFDGAKTF